MTTFKDILRALLHFMIAMSICAAFLFLLYYLAYVMYIALGPVTGFILGLIVTLGIILVLIEEV